MPFIRFLARFNCYIYRLERGVLDPQISDYVFWSDMTAEEIADKALGYKPIEL